MNVAVLFAGGIGSRMNAGSVPKQFLEIHGKPIIVHTLEVFESHPEIDAIAIAILPQGRAELERLVKRFEVSKVRWIVDGGSTGQESRHRALQAVAADCPPDTLVLVHDGVRPLVDHDLISENIRVASERGNAITCTKISETIVVSESDEIDDVIPRDHLYAARAPQTFHLGEILDLYNQTAASGEHDTIDSCTVMRLAGRSLYRVVGPTTNIKVTTGDDLVVARAFFALTEHETLFGREASR
ncbi:IspD/TarI family cytidylyltransferase [Leucobacter sp. USHLN153]|uniref:IspD/TarI family cytidylyltransferase n=1 Tax=Leucobacter sp. USHLN153 TaxID=3081268 RepID=UPI0030196BE6